MQQVDTVQLLLCVPICAARSYVRVYEKFGALGLAYYSKDMNGDSS